jgi:hypothetical protein
MQVRESWFGQPYLTLVGQIGGDKGETCETAEAEGKAADAAA